MGIVTLLLNRMWNISLLDRRGAIPAVRLARLAELFMPRRVGAFWSSGPVRSCVRPWSRFFADPSESRRPFEVSPGRDQTPAVPLPVRRKPRTRLITGRSLSFQQLEARLPLAGDVTIVQQGDLVTITGDRAANGLEIQKNALGTLRITGTIAGSPQSPTTLVLDGQRTDQTFLFDVQRVRIALGRGDDRVILGSQGVAGLPRTGLTALEVDLGDGNNTFDAKGLDVAGAVAQVRSGRNTDAIFLQQATFGGSLSFSTGDGTDTVRVRDDVEILGQLSLDTGNGGGSVTLSDNLALRQGFRCITGTGDENIQLRDGVLIQGDVTVDLGRGNDDFTMADGVGVTGRLSVFGRAGNDRVFFNRTIAILGETLIDTGSGDDLLEVEGSVTVTANATVQLGGGRNDQFIGESASLRVDGNLVVRKEGGTGRVFSGDENVVGPPHFVVGGDLVVEVGSAFVAISADIGRDLLVRGGVNLTLFRGDVGRNATITGGRRRDQVAFDHVVVVGAIRVETGGDEDYVFFETVSVGGGTTVSLGGGNDVLVIRDIFSSAGQFDGGGGRDGFRYPSNLVPPPHVGFEWVTAE